MYYHTIIFTPSNCDDLFHSFCFTVDTVPIQVGTVFKNLMSEKLQEFVSEYVKSNKPDYKYTNENWRDKKEEEEEEEEEREKRERWYKRERRKKDRIIPISLSYHHVLWHQVGS